MTNEQFLQVFRRHLAVGGPKRAEIIAEVASHLQEQPADKLGDPKLLARTSNRVHVGLFPSFLSLAITAAIVTVLFDVLIPYLQVRFDASGSAASFVQFFWSIVPLISPILFIYGAHAISRMRNRWVYTAVLAGIFTVGFAIQQELMQATGYLLVASVDGSTSVWTIHIQPVVNFLLPYVIIGYGVMAITAGRQLIVSRHPVIDVALAFLLGTAAARYLIPMIWNTITNYHYTLAMSEWSAAAFNYLTLASITIGVLCAGVEWLRIRSVQRIHPTAYQRQ